MIFTLLIKTIVALFVKIACVDVVVENAIVYFNRFVGQVAGKALKRA